ncbi:MAG TPA: hypothetical protein VMV87_01870 [Burkholderiales bacterium]|nr:hypothetical protein [Burkholderiales bacterium]
MALNGFALARIVLEEIPGAALCGTAANAVSRRTDGDVLLFSGFEALVRREPEALHPLFEQLGAAAAGRREGGLRFFAVFLDPLGVLPLAQLYNWHRSAATKAL